MTDRKFHLRLPATSANLGSAFDTAAIALNLYLDVTAELAATFCIEATGRNAAACSKLENNLLFDTYAQTLQENGRETLPLQLSIHNEIPFGMGCGSSAAARLAGIALAVHFGELGWDRDAILKLACLLEGHPDNAAACWLGGMTVATMEGEGTDARVHAVSIPVPSQWCALIVMPSRPLATNVSRGALPERYSRQAALANVQHASLLIAAFAQGRGDLLRVAMEDFLHQPYRVDMCPLLPKIAPLTGQNGVLGVALSGAGPAVLMVVDRAVDRARLHESILQKIENVDTVEILDCEFIK
ncbi:MAG TPA: homoserine kinase [Acidobacteriaceae bacterium]|jgi:homoserine kinase|nr:homoserine kinase [Acidobacteriaceae bacterium]